MDDSCQKDYFYEGKGRQVGRGTFAKKVDNPYVEKEWGSSLK